MSFTFTDSANNYGDSASASTGVHGISINSGDLVVIYVSSNSTSTMSVDAGGTSWTEAIDEQPSGETARQGLFWKVAGGSEPTSYTVTLGNAGWNISISVFTSASDAEVDVAATSSVSASSVTHLFCDAIDGVVINDNVLSVVAGGKDNRKTSELYTQGDNIYTGATGRTDEQAGGMAHRVYTTGHSSPFSGGVRIDTADTNDGINDKAYSVHISFKEGGGAPASIIPQIMHHRSMMQ